MGLFPFGASPALELQATTGEAGFALQDATPNILTWTAPADGNLHRFMVFFYCYVTSALTGGQINLQFKDPLGNTVIQTFLGASQGSGSHGTTDPGYLIMIVASGQEVILSQESAVTAGAGIIWAELWGA